MAGVTVTGRPDRWVRAATLSRLRRGGAVASVVVLLVSSWLVVQAVIMPGNDSFRAKLAEAAREDGLGPLVTAADGVSARLGPARSTPRGAAPVPAMASVTLPSPMRRSVEVGLHPALPALVTPALPGEGVFRSVVTVAGQPAVQVATLRPERGHQASRAAVVWISGTLTRLVQHPGTVLPGRPGQWSVPSSLPAALRAGLIASFDSGLQRLDGHAGYYADRRTVGRLTPGVASLVIYSDGTADVGAWGTELGMTPRVASVRQNLTLLVDRGQVTAGPDRGAVRSGWRSGIGVTAAGDLVYVIGEALSPASLAALLVRAGAVRAMPLDADPERVAFVWYSVADDDGAVVPHKVREFPRPADRFLTTNSRDFVAVYGR